MRFVGRFLIVIVATALALPAAAVRLVPGTYKMNWDERREFADPLWQKLLHDEMPTGGYLTQSRYMIDGAVSKRAVCGRTGGDSTPDFPVVLDESKGTGKGYDTIYLGEADSYPQSYDIKSMTRISLTKRQSVLQARGYLATVPSWATRGKSGPKRRFDVSVERSSDHGDYKVSVYVRGAWRGAIKTSNGKIAVRLMDSSDLDGVDSIILGSPDTETLIRACEDQVKISLNQPQTYDNIVYKLSFNKSKGVLRVEPYKGPMGTLVINPVDGKGRLLSKGTAWLSGERASGNLSYHILGKQSLSLPAGVYRSVRLYLYTGKISDSQRMMLNLELPGIRIATGEVVKISAGGPLKFKMTVDKDALTGTRCIICTPQLPGVKSCDVYGTKPSLILKDSGGKVIYSESRRANSSDCPFRFDLPKGLRPGSYAALLTVDMTPYDKTRVFGAQLRVE